MKHSSGSRLASASLAGASFYSSSGAGPAQGKNERGEYRQFVHIFNLREPPDSVVCIDDHYAYPWPLDSVVAPTVDYLNAVYKLGGFEVWPASWQHFWAEYEMVRRGPFAKREMPKVHGPYLMLFPGHGLQLPSQMLVDIKRQVLMKTVSSGLIGTRERVLYAVCQKLAPYLALPTREIEACESLT